jgi:pSer/pThr/pTyr-binding forkhead associated (FHA) protein
MKVSLLVAEGVRTGMEVPVVKFPFIMGRSPKCHLRPASEQVSKQHCCLLTRAGKIYVHDFNSRNGTFVNGERVTGPTELSHGDTLTVGPLGFTVRLIDAVPVDQATPLPAHREDLLASDEEEVANLLLEMDANEVEAESEEEPHSTTVEIELPQAAAPAAPAPPIRKPASAPKPAASTADAAQKLLAQMARRDRK